MEAGQFRGCNMGQKAVFVTDNVALAAGQGVAVCVVVFGWDGGRADGGEEEKDGEGCEAHFLKVFDCVCVVL